MNQGDPDRELKELLRQVKDLAARYYRLTGRPLGATGEIAEYEAAQKLGLTLAPPRMAAFDAGRTETFQIKGRAVAAGNRYRLQHAVRDCPEIST